MTKKFIWLIISCLMVAALILASCAPAVVEEKEAKVVTKEPEKKVEEVVEKPAVGEPQFGGTLNVWFFADDPASPDIKDGYHIQTVWLSPVQERPFIGALEKYGLRGTGEYDFELHAYIPDKYMEGNLLESWEVSPDKTVWHVRPGIYWAPHGNQLEWMEPRELTAEDIVADLLIFQRSPAGGKSLGVWGGDIYATDRYTLVIEFTRFDANWIYIIGYEDRAHISPPEMEIAGPDKWENQVGTGPFFLSEYVIGSHMTFERNPDYWKTTTINGKEYQLPFVDRLVYPIIPDVATQVAALRTGKIDLHKDVVPRYWDSLDKTEMLSNKCHVGRGNNVILRCSEPPFDNIDVRRAMMIGTDLKAFADIHGVGPLPKHWFPMFVGNPDVYTPMEELPAETRLLYDYNPDLAKQMLADAGYPNGFQTQISTVGQPAFLDRCSLLKDQWAKIGVDIEINAVDEVTYSVMEREQQYTGTLFGDFAVGNPPDVISRHSLTGARHNYPVWSNESYDELGIKALAESDPVKRNLIIKEISITWLNEVAWIPTDPIVIGHYWWPWIKNYYGERSLGDGEIATILTYAWIDQDLKTKMGY